MNALSNYLEDAFLNHLLLGISAYSPTTLEFSLHTENPGETGSVGEVSGGSYARAVVTNNTTNFPECSSTGVPSKTNGTAITFPTATDAWGTITHWAVWDDDGDMLAYGELSVPNIIASGKTPNFAAGAISISATNGSDGGLSYFAIRKLLDHVIGGTTYTPPSAIYTGLATEVSGQTLTEWDDASYTRQETEFDSPSSGVCLNTNSETFSASVAVSATLTAWGIWDDVSVGNRLAFGTLETSRTPAIADSVTAASGAIKVTLK